MKNRRLIEILILRIRNNWRWNNVEEISLHKRSQRLSAPGMGNSNASRDYIPKDPVRAAKKRQQRAQSRATKGRPTLEGKNG